jgi:hypothetical protein
MKLSTLNTKKPAEDGAKLHLRHTSLPHELYYGEGCDEQGRIIDSKKDHKPVIIYVRGMESETVNKVNQENGEKRLTDKGLVALDKSKDPNHIPTVQDIRRADEFTTDSGYRVLSALVIDWEGLIDENDKPLACNEANKLAFFKGSAECVKQILDFSKEASNFFNEGLNV